MTPEQIIEEIFSKLEKHNGEHVSDEEIKYYIHLGVRDIESRGETNKDEDYYITTGDVFIHLNRWKNTMNGKRIYWVRVCRIEQSCLL